MKTASSLLLLLGLLLGLLPAVGIFYLFIYKIYNDLRKKEFEKKGNIILTRARLDDLLPNSTPHQLLMIFKSAICDHSEVDGFRYYTRFPFGLKIVNAIDDHRRALIAHEIGQMLIKGVVHQDDTDICSDILLCLTDFLKETSYTQLMAWNGLTRLVGRSNAAFTRLVNIDYLKECLAKNYLSGLGVVKFIFNVMECEGLDETSKSLLKEIIFYTLDKGSPALLAFLVFKLSSAPSLDQLEKREILDHLPDNPRLNKFLMHMEALSFGFTREELSEGLKNLGLQSPPYSRKSTEGEIAQILVKHFIEEIYVPTSYLLSSYNSDDSRQEFSYSIWL